MNMWDKKGRACLDCKVMFFYGAYELQQEIRVWSRDSDLVPGNRFELRIAREAANYKLELGRVEDANTVNVKLRFM